MSLIVGIYAAWLGVAAAMYLLGATANIMAVMLGAPIGWTIGIASILWSQR